VSNPSGPATFVPPDSPNGFRGALGRSLVLLDAAMGTRLLDQGLRLEDDDPCLWNLTHPEAVLAIHRRDVAAGAEAILSNTFGANRHALARLGRGTNPDVAAINQAAVALARRAAGPGRFVVGGLGPTAADGDAVGEQAAVLIAAGVDALLFETHRLDQAEAALHQLDRAACGPAPVPLLVSLLAWPVPSAPALTRLVALGAAAVGGNCQDGMAAAIELAERLRATTTMPLIVKPAAGRPGGPMDGPRAFATAVSRLKALRPVLVGGCCGTDETHLAAVWNTWYDEQSPGE
jgi:5-methyltetrahydrofolate--homocysteine methyltransferase